MEQGKNKIRMGVGLYQPLSPESQAKIMEMTGKENANDS